MSPELTAAIVKLREKGEALGIAKTIEQGLEDDRAAIKADAIVRVMKREGIAATRAEAIVETDEEYFLHREKQRASIVARYKADAEYWAAKAEATQASLTTHDVLTLEAENLHFSCMIDDLDREVNDLRQKVVATMRARDDANASNRDLIRANAELSHQIAVANELIGSPVIQSALAQVSA